HAYHSHLSLHAALPIFNRHNSSLVLFDRFSLENYNSITFAKSGAGKSYATKLEILRTLMFDTDVIVIDPEREYEYLAESTGGKRSEEHTSELQSQSNIV